MGGKNGNSLDGITFIGYVQVKLETLIRKELAYEM